ncbi:hypothetical protein NVP2095A_49 [Vibrio phage 2.095.A._10N.286.46.E10]|nr:hypothetical protein NVP2095A_49 [Vibrio phage 2.095.A._10N.286.46.E10]AUS02207.1 hypothetical protein NVP2095B_49 [Vibrio phage 2.095.B._10N.286.46.E10]
MSEAKFTKGPWQWEVNKSDKNVELCGRGIEVLRFKRWGMQSAKPTFTKKDSTFKLQGACPSNLTADIKGREHHSDWCQTIDHPDAHLIASAPEMYEMLRALSEMCSEDAKFYLESSSDVIDLLAKARGEHV